MGDASAGTERGRAHGGDEQGCVRVVQRTWTERECELLVSAISVLRRAVALDPTRCFAHHMLAKAWLEVRDASVRALLPQSHLSWSAFDVGFGTRPQEACFPLVVQVNSRQTPTKFALGRPDSYRLHSIHRPAMPNTRGAGKTKKDVELLERQALDCAVMHLRLLVQHDQGCDQGARQNTVARLELAQILHDKAPHEALALYRSVTEVSPCHVGALLGLANLLQAQGRKLCKGIAETEAAAGYGTKGPHKVTGVPHQGAAASTSTRHGPDAAGSSQNHQVKDHHGNDIQDHQGRRKETDSGLVTSFGSFDITRRWAQDMLREAASTYQRVLRLDPGNSSALTNLCELLLTEQSRRGACSRKNEENVSTARRLMETYGNERASERHPPNTRARQEQAARANNMACLHELGGDHDNARRILEQLVNPDAMMCPLPAIYNLARLLQYGFNDHARAEQLYEHVVRMSASSSGGLESLDALERHVVQLCQAQLKLGRIAVQSHHRVRRQVLDKRNREAAAVAAAAAATANTTQGGSRDDDHVVSVVKRCRHALDDIVCSTVCDACVRTLTYTHR